MTTATPTSLLRINPIVEKLHPYVPGEQPREGGWIKLNTNENAFSPPESVLRAIQEEAASGALNKYPDPLCAKLREAIGADLGFASDEIFIGNGSDELLRLVFQPFTEPGDKIAALFPTYVLYETLAAMFGCETEYHNIEGPRCEIPQSAWKSEARIFFLANPNPPYGTYYSRETVEDFVTANPSRLVVVDEAYVDFSPGSLADLCRSIPNLLIFRTFSKGYSLAGMRVGFALGQRELISQFYKVKDSYNVSRLSQAAATAAWKDRTTFAQRNREIAENREYLAARLRKLGFDVPESRGNFLFAKSRNARDLQLALKERKILVRYFDIDGLRDGIRITISRRLELEALLATIQTILSEGDEQTR